MTTTEKRLYYAKIMQFMAGFLHLYMGFKPTTEKIQLAFDRAKKVHSLSRKLVSSAPNAAVFRFKFRDEENEYVFKSGRDFSLMQYVKFFICHDLFNMTKSETLKYCPFLKPKKA